jgi:hypothetical protein
MADKTIRIRVCDAPGCDVEENVERIDLRMQGPGMHGHFQLDLCAKHIEPLIEISTYKKSRRSRRGGVVVVNPEDIPRN